MSELFHLYRWTFFGGLAFAGALSYLGCHLAARDRAMQTLCIGQGALLGVLMAMGLGHTLSHPEEDTLFGPFVIGFVFSGLTYFVTHWVVRHRVASKNTHFAGVFAILVALGYLITAIFPQLESHMSQIYFGDLATLSERDSMVAACLGVLSLLIFAATWKRISSESFELAVYGRARSRFFNALALVVLAFSVQFLGFLFTVGMLFLPTMILSGLKSKGLARHYIFCIAVSLAGTACGFLMSLQWTRLPTVPTIVVATSVLAYAVSIVDAAAFRVRALRQ